MLRPKLTPKLPPHRGLPGRPRPREGRLFGHVRLFYGAKLQGSGGRACQKCASQGSEEQGGTQRQGLATCSVHQKAPHGLSARVMRVTNPVGVVAQCLLDHHFDLRYPGASMDHTTERGSPGTPSSCARPYPCSWSSCSEPSVSLANRPHRRRHRHRASKAPTSSSRGSCRMVRCSGRQISWGSSRKRRTTEPLTLSGRTRRANSPRAPTCPPTR